MGRMRQLARAVLLFCSVSMLLVLPAVPALADYESGSASAARNASKPVAIKNLPQKMETTNGECGIMFPGKALGRKIGREERRKLCFALQSYGFLTRYVQSVDTAASAWSHDVCLLLSFCGDGCHRLYGHSQHKIPQLNLQFGVSEHPPASVRVAEHKELLSARTGVSSLEAMIPKDGQQSKPSREQLYSAAVEKYPKEFSHITTVNNVGDCQPDGFSSKEQKDLVGLCPHHFMSLASPGISKRIYTLDFEAHHQGFSRFLARLALLIGAADIEKVVDIERQLRQYIEAKQMRTLQGLHSAVPRQELLRGGPSSASLALADSSSRSVGQHAHREASMPVQHLEVLLEPISGNQSAAAQENSASSESEVQSIQLIFPSSFKAVVSQVQPLGQSGPPARRLRGSNAAVPGGPGGPVRKPASAEIMLNSFVHCSSASSFMSVRPEMKWLQEFVYFLPHQK